MSDITRILCEIEQGDPSAADELLPLVYDELRKLAATKLAREKPGQTLQPTALVHDAYLRLVDVERAQRWDSRGHFFSAAAEAQEDGWVYVIDLRTPDGPQGRVPQEDIIGAFEVRDGKVVADSYWRNEDHVPFSENGFMSLPPSLEDAYLAELRRVVEERGRP